jgi:hypothetical protein
MWELFPSKVKYGLPTIIAIFTYLFFNQYIGRPLISSVSYTITTITILAWFFGKYLWKYVYIDFFKKIFALILTENG